MPMRKLRVTMFVVIVSSMCAGPAVMGGAKAQSGDQAKIVDFSFDPVSSTIDVGTTVTWTNTGDRPHTVTDRGGTFDTGPVSPGADASIPFSTPGRYFFFCRINPSKMNGTITVEVGGQASKVVRVQALDPAREGEELGFDPNDLEVQAGTAVVLANVGGKPHSLTADDGSFDTGIVNPGAQGGRFAGANATIVPGKAGTFPFHCEVHPEVMKGVLTVTGQAPPGTASAASAPNKASVKIVDFGFDPAEASVAPGGTVTWSNTGQAQHTATFDDVEDLDTGQLPPGEDGALVAPAEPGSYSYRCNVHPAKMRGVLVVVGQATGDPTKADAGGKKDVAAPASAGGGVSTLALVTVAIGALLGGFGVGQFVRNKPG
jgi:plastocyanin